MRLVMLDTETTGLSAKKGDRMIELGCVEMVDRRLTGHNLHLYFNPERNVGAGAVRVHGITDDFLIDKPLFHECAQEVLDYLAGSTLVIHNSAFDLGFLDMEFKKTRLLQQSFSSCFESIDTLGVARKKHPGARCSLDALCKRYDIDLSKRSLHGALLDAELLASVYLALTGGQAQMFSESNQAEVVVSEYEWLDKMDNMAVILPTEHEKQEHETYLKQMKQATGVCLWEES